MGEFIGQSLEVFPSALRFIVDWCGRAGLGPVLTTLLLTVISAAGIFAVVSYFSSARRTIRRMWRSKMLVLVASGLLIAAGIGVGFYAYVTLPKTIPIAFEVPGLVAYASRQPWANVTGADANAGTVEEFDYGDVTISNISTDASVSLDIFLHVRADGVDLKLRADARGPWGLTYGVNDLTSQAILKTGRQPRTIFNSPVVLQPQGSTQARLVFIVSPIDDDMRLALIRGAGANYALILRDNISGVSIELQIPTKYRDGVQT